MAVEEPARAILHEAATTCTEPSKAMQSFGQTQPPSQPAQYYTGQMQQQAQGTLERMRNWMQQCIQNSADTLRVYVNQYPPLAAYLFTLMVLSAIPLTVFGVFAITTATVILSIALVGFAAVEGTILMVSGGVLLSVLGGIGLFTTIGFAILSVVYLGYRSFTVVFGRFWEGAGSMTSRLQEVAQQATQKVHEVSGGVPSPVGPRA